MFFLVRIFGIGMVHSIRMHACASINAFKKKYSSFDFFPIYMSKDNNLSKPVQFIFSLNLIAVKAVCNRPFKYCRRRHK